MTDPETAEVAKFRQEAINRVSSYHANADWHSLSLQWLTTALSSRYVYNFNFLGRPIIQLPQDMVAIQSLVWAVRPDLIIETGVAHGGSLIQSAGMLALLDYCDAAQRQAALEPRKSSRAVVGVDVEIRKHNREAIEAHPLAPLIHLIEGSSIDPSVIDQIRDFARGYQRVLVLLDSMHTHSHVLSELEAYAPLVSAGSYCVVFDTIIEDMPVGFYSERPWDRGNNPSTAVQAYLNRLDSGTVRAMDGNVLRFSVDEHLDDQLMLTVSPGGFLRRVDS